MRLNVDLTQKDGVRNMFFTSDFHLFHVNVIELDKRPFADVHEMHDVIEKNWNGVVKVDDIVIYLGDLSFARRKDIKSVDALIKRLNGTIHYVLGNHDKIDDIKKYNRFASVQDYLEVRITHMAGDITAEKLFCCMHYPIYSWNNSHHGSYMIHGHSHMGLSNSEFHLTHRIFDVGCMGYEFKPVPYSKILELGRDIKFTLVNNHHKNNNG